jgi:hypothetical protein
VGEARGGCWWLGLLMGGINFSIYSTFFEPVSALQNRTKPEFFLTILIRFFSRFSFFD